MAVCPKGRFVVTAGQDRTIRLWEKTLEPLVLEDEREEERRIQEEEAGTTIQTPVVVGERGSEAVRPTILTKETEKAVKIFFKFGFHFYLYCLFPQFVNVVFIFRLIIY